MGLFEATAVILIVSGFFSMMVLAVILPGHPQALRIVSRFVCMRGARMEIRSSSSDGAESRDAYLTVVRRGSAGVRVITARPLVTLFILTAVISAPLAALVLCLI